MKPSTIARQQSLFINAYVLLFILSVFLPRIANTTAPYYKILTTVVLCIMPLLAGYVIFLSIAAWRKGIDKKTTISLLLLIGQIVVLIGTVLFLFYKFWK